jgi:hypothetical protein
LLLKKVDVSVPIKEKRRIFRFFVCCLNLFVLVTILNGQIRIPSINADSSQSFDNSGKLNCGVDLLLKDLRKNVIYVSRENMMNDIIQKKINGGPSDPVLVLPVVVHIINSNPYSISDADIINGIKNLNEAFSKSGKYVVSNGVDTRIQFKLAQRGSAGGITSGINRVVSFFGSDMNMYIEDTRMKNLIQWDPSRFINIWLLQNIKGEIFAGFTCGVWYRSNATGYATMPTSAILATPSPTDGIVVPSLNDIVLPHEMGHYLGLYHTFEGGCTNNNCTTDGDKVCDTPPDALSSAAASCTQPTNSCTSDTLSNHSNGFILKDMPDPISNFMDYGNEVCSNQFTQGQADRMRATILTMRPGLWPGKESDAISLPCNENISAKFSRNNPYPKSGETIVFTPLNAGLTTYQWYIGDVLVLTSATLSKTFTNTGKYKITLKVFNNAGCYASYTDYVIVTCGVTARFFANKRLVASRVNVLEDTVLFKNLSEGANSYQWVFMYSPLVSFP